MQCGGFWHTHGGVPATSVPSEPSTLLATPSPPAVAPTPSPALVRTHPLPVCGVSALDMSRQWSHPPCGPAYPASLPERRVFTVRPRHGACQCLPGFHGQVTAPCGQTRSSTGGHAVVPCHATGRAWAGFCRRVFLSGWAPSSGTDRGVVWRLLSVLQRHPLQVPLVCRGLRFLRALASTCHRHLRGAVPRCARCLTGCGLHFAGVAGGERPHGLLAVCVCLKSRLL